MTPRPPTNPSLFFFSLLQFLKRIICFPSLYFLSFLYRSLNSIQFDSHSIDSTKSTCTINNFFHLNLTQFSFFLFKLHFDTVDHSPFFLKHSPLLASLRPCTPGFPPISQASFSQSSSSAPSPPPPPAFICAKYIPGWASLVAQMVKNPPAMRETWVPPCVGKIPWRRAWQFTPVFLPGESHGQRNLAGCSPWGRKKSDTTEQLSTAQSTYTWVNVKGHIFLLICLKYM